MKNVEGPYAVVPTKWGFKVVGPRGGSNVFLHEGNAVEAKNLMNLAYAAGAAQRAAKNGAKKK